MRLQDVDSFSLPNNIAPEPTGSGAICIWSDNSGLHDTALARTCCHFHAERMVSSISRGCPSEYFVGICRVGPYLFDVAGAAWCDTVGTFTPVARSKAVMSSITLSPLPVPRLKISILASDLSSSIRSTAITWALARSTTSMKSRMQ